MCSSGFANGSGSKGYYRSVKKRSAYFLNVVLPFKDGFQNGAVFDR
jgi:hypothetical protein